MINNSYQKVKWIPATAGMTQEMRVKLLINQKIHNATLPQAFYGKSVFNFRMVTTCVIVGILVDNHFRLGKRQAQGIAHFFGDVVGS